MRPVSCRGSLALAGALGFFLSSPAYPAAVTGTVLDAGERPILGAGAALLPLLTSYEAGYLRLYGQAEPEPIALTRTDAAGRFRLEAPAGVFRVVVQSPERLSMQYAPLPLVEDEELPELLLQPATQLNVRVADERGRPIAGAWVLATASTAAGKTQSVGGAWREDLRLARTRGQGEIALPRAAGEELDVIAFYPGRGERRVDRFEGGTISLPEPPGEMRLLRVMGSEGKFLSSILITAGEHTWPLGITAEDGSLDVALPPGPTRLGLLADDGRRQSFDLSSPPPTGGDVMHLADARRLWGHIAEDTDNRPLAGALVWASHEPGRFVCSDSEGNYELVVPAGGFQLQALSAGFLPKRARHKTGDLRRGQFPTLALARSGSLRGRVVDAGGRPVDGARLVAFADRLEESTPRGLEILGRASTDAQGGFRLGPLRPGSPYQIAVAKDGFFSSASRAVAYQLDAAEAPLRVVLTRSRPGRGWVKDGGGSPVPGAEVILMPGSQGLVAAAQVTLRVTTTVSTDASGRFSVAELPAARLDLLVRKQGFAPAHRRGLDTAGGEGPLDLGTVVLFPGSLIAGRVLDAKGRPIAGASVYRLKELRQGTALEPVLYRLEPDTVTGNDGRFELRDLARGRPWQVAARADGFLPSSMRGVRPPVQGLTLRLEAGTKLRGRLVDPAGEPVPGGLVEVASAMQAVRTEGEEERSVGPPTVRTTTSDHGGRFELRNLPARHAKLAVSASGFVPVEELPVDLPRPAGAPELVVVLEPGATIEGMVRRAAGDPVAGARVLASGVSATTDDDGYYSLTGVAAGRTVVEVVHPHYPRARQQILVDSPLARLDFELPDGVPVSGRVVDARGESIAGVQLGLTARSSKDQRDYHALSQADGRFQFSQVATGRYRLRTQDSAHAPFETADPVVVAAEPVEGLEIVLPDEAVIRGRVLGLTEAELSALDVHALRNSGSGAPARIDAGGHYEIRALPAGDWRVRASLRSDERQVEAFVSLKPGQQVERDLEFGGRLALRGAVVFDGEPLPEATVSLRAHHHSLERSVVTDWQGGFRFEELEPDTYWLGVDHPLRQLVHNETVKIAEDREIVISLSAASIAGSVRDQNTAQPIAGALLELRPAPGSGVEFLMTGETRADGSFRLSRVPSGSYRLTARSQSHTPAAVELVIDEHTDLTGLEISLEPADGLRLTVRLADGRIPQAIHVIALGPDGLPRLAETRTHEPGGDFFLSTLAAGSWTLLVGADGGALSAISVSVPSEPLAVTLPPAGKLTVSVPDLATSGLVATVRLLDQQGQSLQTIGLGGQLETRWPLAAGHGVVANVPAGAWKLVAEAPDGRLWTASVSHPGLGDVAVVVE